MKRKMIMKKLSLLALSTFIVTNSIMSVNINAETISTNINKDIIEGVSDSKEDYKQIGGIESYKQDENKVTFKMTTGEWVRVSFLDDQVFRLYMDPSGKFQEDPTPNATDHVTKIVNKSEDEYKRVVPNIEDGDILKVSTDTIELRIEKSTGKMELFNKVANKTVWKETEALKYKNNSTVQTLETNDEEYFYGGGVQNGRFSHKGKMIEIKNTNNWVDGGVASPTPFYFSSNGYGVMRNTFKPGEYDFSSTENNKVTTKHNETRFDAYYFVEENPTDIINEFTELTGKPLLIPEYSFYLGHANCYSRDFVNDETGAESPVEKPGFDRQETLMVDAKKVVDDHINNDMPIGWFLPNDGYGCGYGRADTIDENVDNLKQFVDYSADKGIKTGLWTQSQLYPTGNQEAYLERDIEKEVGVAGTVGVKTDVAWVGEGYSFGLNSVRQAAEGIMDNSKEKARPFVVAVDGWAGTQRYSTIWSGDQTGGNWEYIRFHIPTYIGSGLSGQPNIGSDMDGIYGGDSVIQTRDFQWKAFTPIQIDMDGWGSNAKNPYVFGDPYTSINRMYLKLKAEMMPYNYSIANEATNKGTPMIRAMMLEEQNEYTYGTATEYQYMWGPNLLVAPIYQDTVADENGNDKRHEIYLPNEDQIWIDYFSGEQYRGGGVLNNFDAPIWKMPLFVKNGAIIPMSNENNSPEFIDDSKRIYEVYPSGDTSFEVYEDDGLTVDYKEGKSANTLVTSSAPKTGEGKAVINVGLLTGDYEGIVKERTTDFIVNVSKKPTDLSVKVGETNVDLKEATSLEEFNNGTNMYFYDEAPNLNKYATEGSEFADVEIIATPKVYVKVEKTNVKENTVQLTINDFENTQTVKEVDSLPKDELNKNLATPTKLNAPKDLITPRAIELRWDAVDGATSYDVEVNGEIFRKITKPQFKDTNVTFDTVYNYRVRSVNNDGYSEWSEKISPKTPSDPYLNVPEGMVVEWTEGNESAFYPSNAVDNDESTRFMSKNPTAIDKPFIVDMQKVYEIGQVDVLCRNVDDGSGKGGILRTELYSSIDGVNYEKVYSNAEETGEPIWVNRGEPNVVKLDKPIKARYFKLVAKETVGDYLSIREFRPIKVDEKVDIIVSKAKNLKANEVTKNTVKLTWDAPETTEGLDGYVIYKDGKEIGEVKETSYEIENLKANTIYGFKVSSKYSNGKISKPVSANVRTKK